MQESFRLRKLKRLSHYMMDRPSATLRKGGLYFSSSAVEELNIARFQRCYVSIKEGSNPEEASEIFIEFNNDPDGEENAPVKIGKNGVGATVSQLGTVWNQLNYAKALMNKKRNERRLFLEKDSQNGLWKIRLIPYPNTKSKDFVSIPEISSIYFLLLYGSVIRIGETSNLKRRIAEYKRDEFSFDEVIYCNMNSFSDDERKSWETYHISKYVSEKGSLPPGNFQNGRAVN